MLGLVQSKVMDKSTKFFKPGSISGSLNTNVVDVGGKFIDYECVCPDLFGGAISSVNKELDLSVGTSINKLKRPNKIVPSVLNDFTPDITFCFISFRAIAIKSVIVVVFCKLTAIRSSALMLRRINLLSTPALVQVRGSC